jgi:HEAT repeat protein
METETRKSAEGPRAGDAEVTEAEVRALVDRLEDGATRWPAWKRLEELGAAAAPAVREGLRHGHWQVRKWCAVFLDHHADPESLPELLPLLHDPKSDVRLWAVHSLSCDRCKVDKFSRAPDPGRSSDRRGAELEARLDKNPIDFVPHLIERIERDESIRVRRMAVLMLTIQPDVRAARLFTRILARETDGKLRKHAEWGLKRCREVGLAPAATGPGPAARDTR